MFRKLKYRWRRFWGHFSRTAMLQGSPAYRISVSLTGFCGGILWIYMSERRNPEDAKIFRWVFHRYAPQFTAAEIRSWNESLSGGQYMSDAESRKRGYVLS